MPLLDTVTRELLCDLNERELRERGDEMAAAELRAETLKAERRRLNASIREQTDRRTVLAAAIDARKELREVACEWRPDYKRKVCLLVRADTQEKLPEERDLTSEELQLRMATDVPGKARKAAAAKGGKSKKKRAA